VRPEEPDGEKESLVLVREVFQSLDSDVRADAVGVFVVVAGMSQPTDRAAELAGDEAEDLRGSSVPGRARFVACSETPDAPIRAPAARPCGTS
jgi:hypothetical protein